MGSICRFQKSPDLITVQLSALAASDDPLCPPLDVSSTAGISVYKTSKVAPVATLVVALKPDIPMEELKEATLLCMIRYEQ